jgi:hypothetical protein
MALLGALESLSENLAQPACATASAAMNPAHAVHVIHRFMLSSSGMRPRGATASEMPSSAAALSRTTWALAAS